MASSSWSSRGFLEQLGAVSLLTLVPHISLYVKEADCFGNLLKFLDQLKMLSLEDGKMDDLGFRLKIRVIQFACMIRLGMNDTCQWDGVFVSLSWLTVLSLLSSFELRIKFYRERQLETKTH